MSAHSVLPGLRDVVSNSLNVLESRLTLFLLLVGHLAIYFRIQALFLGMRLTLSWVCLGRTLECPIRLEVTNYIPTI